MKVVITILCLICLGQTSAQSSLPDLPGMTDWFLSTGDWNRDPELYIREYGSGEDTVVMLHGGWGGEHSGLIDAVAGLSEEYHFIFYDQRGSLRSPFADSLISFSHHIDDLELLRKELDLDKIVLVGHSMGSVLASAYASQYPDRIKNLILLAPAYLKNPIPNDYIDILKVQQEKHRLFMNRPEVSEQLEKYSLNRETRRLSSREETAVFRINFAKRMLYDITKWPLLKGGRALYKGNIYNLTEASYPEEGWNYVADFKKSTYPISIIVGDHDFLDFGNGLANKWVIEVPRIQLSLVANAGHMIWVDQPEIFSKELREQLSK